MNNTTEINDMTPLSLFEELKKTILVDEDKLTFTVIPSNEMFDPPKLKVGKYSVEFDGRVDIAVRNILKHHCSANVGFREYKKFLNQCSFKQGSIVPSYQDILKHNIGFIDGPVAHIYPSYDMSVRVELIAHTVLCDTLDEAVYQRYAYFLSIEHTEQGYKVRGVLKERFRVGMVEVDTAERAKGIEIEMLEVMVNRCNP